MQVKSLLIENFKALVALDAWREGAAAACSYRCPLPFNTEALKRFRYWWQVPTQFSEFKMKRGKLCSENQRKDIRVKTDCVAVRTLSWNLCISRLSKVGWVSWKRNISRRPVRLSLTISSQAARTAPHRQVKRCYWKSDRLWSLFKSQFKHESM